jgi:hypothetical protein
MVQTAATASDGANNLVRVDQLKFAIALFNPHHRSNSHILSPHYGKIGTAGGSGSWIRFRHNCSFKIIVRLKADRPEASLLPEQNETTHLTPRVLDERKKKITKNIFRENTALKRARADLLPQEESD